MNDLEILVFLAIYKTQNFVQYGVVATSLLCEITEQSFTYLGVERDY